MTPPGIRTLFFIVGAGRSGSSWLAKSLDSHPEILCRYEGHFCGGRGWDDSSAPRTLDRILESTAALRAWHGRGPGNLWTLGTPFEEDALAFTRAIALCLLDRAAAREGKAIVGDKSIPSSLAMDRLHRIFPEARVFHLTRDGRDFAVSFQFRSWHNRRPSGSYWPFLRDFYRHAVGDPAAPVPDVDAMDRAERATMEHYLDGGSPSPDRPFFSPERIDLLARIWRAHVLGAREGRRRFDDAYLEVRYEDLIARPQESLRPILASLGARTDDATVERCVEANRFEVHRSRAERGDPAFMDPRFYREGKAGGWRAYFRPADLRRFWEIAGDVMESCGYDREPSAGQGGAA